MIPVLLGSTRIPNKNLLLVDGHPLLSYVVRACQESEAFDRIVVNSEHLEFKKLADMLGVEFYHRSPSTGGSKCSMQNKSRQCKEERCQTHDHYLYDFMSKNGPCYLFQVHTTSPLILPETLKTFVHQMIHENYDSLFSIEERYTETLNGDEPLNFSFSKKIPTQTLPPIRSISWALSAWKSDSFMSAYERNNPEENGPTFVGKVGYFPLSKIEALDADTWDDLRIIEGSLNLRRQQIKTGAFKIPEDLLSIEYNLQELIGRDGVDIYKDETVNIRKTNIDEVRAKLGDAPWLHLLFYTATDQTALIYQQPGEGARKHCHVTHDEWWIVLDGTFEWRLPYGKVMVGNKNDILFLPRGSIHEIVCVGDKPGLRLACGARDMEHLYVK